MNTNQNFDVTENINNEIKTKPKNTKKITRLIPDIKNKLNQVRKIKKLWPISGWAINSNITGIIIKKLKKYL